MKKITTVCVLLLVCSVVLVSFSQIGVVKAQEKLSLTITPDGSVEPNTDLLERNGTTYTFKGDILGSIMVQTDNITIDGAGFTISQGGITLAGPDLSHRDCRYILVKNVKLLNSSLYTVGASNNTFVNNYFDNVYIHIQAFANITGNLFKSNTFNDSGIFVDYNRGGRDVFTENNFFNSGIGVGLSVSPIVEKNYWSDYNGTDADGDGVGDTPHVSQYKVDEEDVLDNSPLITPLDIEIPEFPSWTPLLIALAAVVALAVVYRKRLA
jgi:hypothetical protein